MARVVVHPGFHKTGTSSLQTYLTKHRAALCPYMAFYGKDDFLQAGAAARLYAQRPFRWRLWLFRRRLDRFLATISDAPVVVLSRETFSGSMPGHRRMSGRLITRYHDVAVPLGHQINAALRARFGPDVQITYFYTLREREDWIRSVYGHLLRSIHLTCDFNAFRAQFPDLIDPATEAMRITQNLGIADVHCADLHDIGHRRAGPASALLDLIGVPAAVQDALPPAARANAGQDLELQNTFLALNRAGLSKAALKRRKEELRRLAD
ncbi:hypothetical protein SAMN05428995_104161 [Loktanella sp. DSM 29012]|nr:hypothetical protein SAMN05428995_104161 [Loktanella sp. DSM 29012]